MLSVCDLLVSALQCNRKLCDTGEFMHSLGSSCLTCDHYRHVLINLKTKIVSASQCNRKVCDTGEFMHRVGSSCLTCDHYRYVLVNLFSFTM